jgi:hypothetical protein
VVFGYPVGGSVTLPFHASCLRLLGYELAKPERQRLLAQMTHSAGLYVADNRTMLTERFDDRGSPEWLLQVDTDIEFPPTLIETMLELAGEDRKILAASVPLGAYPSCAFRRAETPGVWDCVHPVPTEPVEVDGIATACALIHRDVFDAIASAAGACWWQHLYLPKSPDGTPARRFRYRSQGEDLAFSVRAQAHGFKLWCAHVPGLGHYKTRRCSHDDEKAHALATPLDESSDGMGEIVEE